MYITDENDNLQYIETNKNNTNKPNLEQLVKAHTEEREKLQKINATIEFYKSLKDAVRECGGCYDWITENTTIKELADCLAVNDVRFYYVNKSNQRGV